MKILVTGGAGFIGSWVAEAYIKEGHEVLVLDDLSTGKAENVPEGARFVKCDIRDEDAVRGAFAGFRPDVVNHHAAQIDVRKSVEDPAFDASVNIIGTTPAPRVLRQERRKEVHIRIDRRCDLRGAPEYTRR